MPPGKVGLAEGGQLPQAILVPRERDACRPALGEGRNVCDARSWGWGFWRKCDPFDAQGAWEALELACVHGQLSSGKINHISLSSKFVQVPVSADTITPGLAARPKVKAKVPVTWRVLIINLEPQSEGGNAGF